MHPSLRCVLVFTHFYALLTVLNCLYPGWLDELTSPGRLLNEYRRCRALQVETDAILAVEQARKELVEELVDGRLTLREAAARMRDLDPRFPVHIEEDLRRRYVGISAEALYCWRVVTVARGQQWAQPNRPDEVMVRLEAELRELLGPEELDAAE